MVAMEVRDEDVIEMAPADAVLLHLDLGAFAAVYEDILAIKRHDLCGGIATVGRERRVIAEDGDFHRCCAMIAAKLCVLGQQIVKVPCQSDVALWKEGMAASYFCLFVGHVRCVRDSRFVRMRECAAAHSYELIL